MVHRCAGFAFACLSLLISAFSLVNNGFGFIGVDIVFVNTCACGLIIGVIIKEVAELEEETDNKSLLNNGFGYIGVNIGIGFVLVNTGFVVNNW